jgi:hypothetical protein
MINEFFQNDELFSLFYALTFFVPEIVFKKEVFVNNEKKSCYLETCVFYNYRKENLRKKPRQV